MEPRKNLIALVKDRLLSIDAVLPLLLEIKARRPELKPLVLLPGERTLGIVEKNYHILQALKEAGAEAACPKRTRLSLILWQARLLFRMLFARNLVIKFGSTLYKHSAFMRLVKAFSRTVEVKVHMLPFHKSYRDYMREDLKVKFERDPAQYGLSYDFFEDSFDFFLTTASQEEMGEIAGNDRRIPESSFIKLGYIRGLPQWTRFVEEQSASCEAVNSGPYCVFILTCLKKRLEAFNEPRLEALLAESLLVLKKFSHRVKTVFRPHALTEMDVLEKVIRETGFTNYAIDHGHPMILTSKAQFVIGTLFSTTMFDAWLQGTPTVEYCYYDRTFIERLGMRSIGGDACDFFIDRDPAKLEAALESVLSGAFKPVRDPAVVARDYPKDSGEFFKFVDNFYDGAAPRP